MQSIVHFFTQFNAADYYHAAAFLLLGAGAQYTVQLVKVLSKFKLGKNMLRFLNGVFNTLFLAAGTLATGGMSLGNFSVHAAALVTVSTIIYRIHNSVLYTGAEAALAAAGVTDGTPTEVTTPLTTPSPTPVTANQFQ